jgi:hypothetical protein
MNALMHMKDGHRVDILGRQIRIGLFRSSPAEMRMNGGVVSESIATLSRVDGLAFKTGSPRVEDGDERKFEVCIPVAGLRSRLQWRFFGEIAWRVPP